MTSNGGMLLALAALALFLMGAKGGLKRRVWRTDEDGFVFVDGARPSLTPAEQALYEKNVSRWRTAAGLQAVTRGVPLSWVMAIIFAESGGNPNARSPVGAIGLMQLHSAAARQGKTDAQLQDGETNIALGARFLSVIRRPGDQLPEVASKYNAGQQSNGAPHPSSRNPWGMREDAGYIDRVVRANNYEVSR